MPGIVVSNALEVGLGPVVWRSEALGLGDRDVAVMSRSAASEVRTAIALNSTRGRLPSAGGSKRMCVEVVGRQL